MRRFPGSLEPGWHQSGWENVLGWLLPTLFLIALIALVVWAVVRLTGPGRQAAPATGFAPPPSRTDSALEQVRMRYARGDISRDDYLQLTTDLGAPPREGPPETGS
jgi:putative membrane protein